MTALALDSVTAVHEAKGVTVGPTEWRTVSQEDINDFADATGDHQWIHVDADRAAEGPFGSTIAHGFFIISLIPTFMTEVLDLSGFTAAINYGLDKVRLPNPVPVNSRVRAEVSIGAAQEASNGLRLPLTITVEVEGASKPAVVAETITLLA